MGAAWYSVSFYSLYIVTYFYHLCVRLTYSSVYPLTLHAMHCLFSIICVLEMYVVYMIQHLCALASFCTLILSTCSENKGIEC